MFSSVGGGRKNKVKKSSKIDFYECAQPFLWMLYVFQDRIMDVLPPLKYFERWIETRREIKQKQVKFVENVACTVDTPPKKCGSKIFKNQFLRTCSNFFVDVVRVSGPHYGCSSATKIL